MLESRSIYSGNSSLIFSIWIVKDWNKIVKILLHELLLSLLTLQSWPHSTITLDALSKKTIFTLVAGLLSKFNASLGDLKSQKSNNSHISQSSRFYLISFPSKEMKSSQPQLFDMSRQFVWKTISPGFKLATRVDIGVSGDSGMVSVAKINRDIPYERDSLFTPSLPLISTIYFESSLDWIHGSSQPPLTVHKFRL